MVNFANGSFWFLTIGVLLLGAFFAARTLTASGKSFERAIALANSANQSLLRPSAGESAVLKSIDLQVDKYLLVFQISPGGGSTTVLTDLAGVNLLSAKRQ